MKTIYFNIIIPILFIICFVANAGNVLDTDTDWSDVVRGNCSDQNSAWWSSDEAIRISENVLLYQKDCGGWPKNIKMQMVLTDDDKSTLIAEKPGNKDCTIDNGAVDYELTYLSKVYNAISNADVKANIKEGFQLGVQYLIDAQYDNGGWPQFYPLKGGYSDYITYNDDAIIHVMNILKHVYSKDGTYAIAVADSTAAHAEIAFNKGIECILNTQYIQNNKLTVWCAQHDDETLLPALARSYELPSLSGQESAKIITFLMSIDNPTNKIRRAIYSAVKWYNEVKITGKRKEYFTNSDGLNDLRIVDDPNAQPMWARFYTLEDNIPYFCDRDGIKKYSIAEIGYERRMGYSWFNTSGNEVESGNNNWMPKWSSTILASPFSDQKVITKDTVNVMAFANEYNGKNFVKLELIVDTNTTYTFISQSIDTAITNLASGNHSMIIKAIYEGDYIESDTSFFNIMLPTYTLTVYGGIGSGEYSLGSIVQIKADKAPQGKIFDQWMGGNTDYIENIYDSVTNLTIPEQDIIITSYYVTFSNVEYSNKNIENINKMFYPNPVIESLTVDLNVIGDAEIEIFTLQGQKLYSETRNKGIHVLSLKFLPPGQYIITLTDNYGSIYSSKFLKQIEN